MQSEMALRIHMLEQTVTKLRDNLGKKCIGELKFLNLSNLSQEVYSKDQN